MDEESIKTPKNNLFKYLLIGLVVFSILYVVYRPKQIQTSEKTIALSEIATHNTKESCWTTINGGVYDVTKFISSHKGGDKILNACGVDATDFFTGKHPTIGRVHSAVAVKLLESMKIGTLKN